MREAAANEPLLAEFAAALERCKPRMRCRLFCATRSRAVETEIKFAGYLEQQKKSIEKLKAAESVAIPEWMEYRAISGLSREMREKLERVRPVTIGQASRIPGVTPAALSLVHVSIRLQGARRSAIDGADEARRTRAVAQAFIATERNRGSSAILPIY